MEQRNLYKEILDNSHMIMLNANDFFYYATAMHVNIDTMDLEWILPTVEKYPKSGLEACMSFIMKLEPIKPYITEEFIEALEYLNSLDIKEVWSRDEN